MITPDDEVELTPETVFTELLVLLELAKNDQMNFLFLRLQLQPPNMTRAIVGSLLMFVTRLPMASEGLKLFLETMEDPK